ncbi:hypothetical protein QYM36_010141 [Artemia franciscana]|uniref:Uncharacterized protein n=1 Tax=Artemia franciscana TaxID=6661 RepID=A0AA88HUP9_ARTSF|nr:hypothetical protein QYM36_010141 [Artemia franciscana]
MEAQGRGSNEWRVEPQSNVVVVKWYDKRPIRLISTYAAVDPEDTYERWDAMRKEHIKVKRSHRVKE